MGSDRLELQVLEEHAGRTVEDLLRKELGVSGRMLQRLTRKKAFRLNGKPTWLGRRAGMGDRLSVRIQAPAKNTQPQGEGSERIEILHDSEHLWVVYKVPGLLTHRTHDQQPPALIDLLAQQTGIDAHAVHRLDRPVSGALLLAKSSWAHARMDSFLQQRQIHREYLAIVEGRLPESQGVIDAPIGLADGKKRRRAVVSGGEPAKTYFESATELSAISPGHRVLRLRLDTGRTHQLRVHMAHLGCPIVGDRLYGVATEQIPRPALHAARIHFPLPDQPKEAVVVDCPIPKDMAELLETSKV